MKAGEKKPSRTPDLEEVWNRLLTRGWLAERSQDVQDRLFSIARVRVYRPGEPLYSSGEQPRGIYGIARGALDISVPREDGQEIMAHRALAGFWIGDLALFASQPRLIPATAATEVVAAVLSRAQLSGLLEHYPELIWDFYALSHRNVATILQLIANLSIPRAEARIALRLLSVDQRQTHSEDWVTLSQDKLAQLTALSLPTVQRTLRHFAEQGWVELGYGRLRVRDREKLLGMCG